MILSGPKFSYNEFEKGESVFFILQKKSCHVNELINKQVLRLFFSNPIKFVFSINLLCIDAS